MKLQNIYSALLTTDLAAAESWYTKLLGRGPDYRPMETLIRWDLFAQGGLQLATDDNLAGNGALFLVVGDIATERQRLRDLDISLGDDIQGTYSTLAQVRDPDGNQITLATPPSIPAGMTQQWRCAPTVARLDVRYRPRRNPSSSGCFLRLAYFSRAAGSTDAPATSPRFILDSDAPRLAIGLGNSVMAFPHGQILKRAILPLD